VSRTIRYRVQEDDLASNIYRCLGKSKQKPRVLASARLLWLCELAVMPALPGVSLGVKFDMEHDAPAVRGSWVTASAKCTVQKGRYWEWDVIVYDAYGKIAKCTLGFIADVDAEDYTARRVTPKLAARGGRASCWLCVLNAFSLIAVLAIPLQVAYLWHGRIAMIATEIALAIGWLVWRKGLISAICDRITIRRSGKKH
jgi:predicted thioesterase